MNNGKAVGKQWEREGKGYRVQGLEKNMRIDSRE
jgi:hypothetical protein